MFVFWLQNNLGISNIRSKLSLSKTPTAYCSTQLVQTNNAFSCLPLFRISFPGIIKKMKSFILFAVIIISSTTLLVIVDHSVFNRHNDNVHGVQHEYTEINGKTPSGAVGEMDFGANANPVAKSTTLVDDYRSNKIETDRQTGNALIVVKTDTETTSATGNESAIETKSIDKTKPAPAAVPVVTPEEAE